LQNKFIYLIKTRTIVYYFQKKTNKH